jgi:anti-anti-sigma regulatory factor
MSATATTHAHIAYELIDQDNPEVVVIEFLTPEIVGPLHAGELGAQLDSLVRPDWPSHFVIDFARVSSLGSTAFGEIGAFVRRVSKVRFCNLHPILELGAALMGLDDRVEFSDSRPAAIRAARRDARRGARDTVDSWLLAGAR